MIICFSGRKAGSHHSFCFIGRYFLINNQSTSMRVQKLQKKLSHQIITIEALSIIVLREKATIAGRNRLHVIRITIKFIKDSRNHLI